MDNDTQKLIGKVLRDGQGERDAIHIAVLPVVAGEELYRSSRIRLAYGTTNIAMCARGEDYDDLGIGIVDPFLNDRRIKKDSRFFLFLDPGTVTGMRHHWTCPAVDAVKHPANETEEWLRRFAEKWNFDYDEMIASASAAPNVPDSDGYVFGNYITARGIDLHSRNELGDDHDLFWHHMEKLTGKTYDEDHRRSFGWSCSC